MVFFRPVAATTRGGKRTLSSDRWQDYFLTVDQALVTFFALGGAADFKDLGRIMSSPATHQSWALQQMPGIF
jgi:hypothetical protein